MMRSDPAGSVHGGRSARVRRSAGVGVLGLLLALGPAWVSPPPAVATTVRMTDPANGIRYEVDDEDVAAGAVIVNYTGPGGELDIPATVTIAGQDYAVRGIGMEAFAESALTAVTIPDSVVVLRGWAFAGSSSLTEVVLGEGVEVIVVSAFAGTALTRLVVPDSVRSIQASAFLDNDLTEVVLGAGIRFIDERAFAGNRLTEVVVPEGVTTVGRGAFADNPDLTSVVFQGPPPWIGAADDSAPSLGQAPGLLVSYRPRFGDPPTAGGFTTPTWQGYASAALPEPAVQVVFEANGGAGSVAPQAAWVPTSLTPNGFTRAGYDFTGWDTAADGSGTRYADGATYPFDADTTLYAQWAPTSYPVSYALDGGTVGAPANPTSLTVESPATTLTNPTRAGHVFAGWTGTGLTEPTTTVTIPAGSTGPRSYTATWAPAVVTTITLTGPTSADEGDRLPYAVEGFDQHGGSLGDVTALVSLTAPRVTASGGEVTFGFDPGGLGRSTTRTLTATLRADPSITDTLDVSVESAATAIRLGVPTTAAQGGTVTVVVDALDADGAVLGPVTDLTTITSDVASDVIDGDRVTFPHASPHTLTATYAPVPGFVASALVEVTPAATVSHTVTFDTGGGGAVASVTVVAGERVVEPVGPARAGFTFTGWFTDAAATTRHDFTTPVREDLTLYAGWRALVPDEDDPTRQEGSQTTAPDEEAPAPRERKALAVTGGGPGPGLGLAAALSLLAGAGLLVARRVAVTRRQAPGRS